MKHLTDPAKGELSPKFGYIRSLIWPIYPHEYKKIIAMSLMIFLIAFVYNILRVTKDTLLITPQNSGAEVIPFVKVWALMPIAVIMAFVFTRLSNHFSTEKVFYIMISIFVAFFILFTFVLYPLRDYIHPHKTADYFQSILPPGFKGFIAVFRYWSFSLYYVLSELWSNIMLSVMFWGLANEITHVHQAKRFYLFLIACANLSGLLAGYVCGIFSQYAQGWNIFISKNSWEKQLIFVTITTLVASVLCSAILRWMHFQKLIVPLEEVSTLKVKKKARLRESISYLMKSKYLLFLAIIVISYNILVNVTEVLWKDQVKNLYPTNTEFQFYMSRVTFYTGVISTIMALLISGNIVRRFGWTISALITPAIILVTSIFFFYFLFMKEYFPMIRPLLVQTVSLNLIVTVGSIQNCLIRTSKFNFLDSTKEFAFIPLDRESKIKGKACIDGIASRFGKGGGSILLQLLLLFFANIAATVPYVALIVLILLVVWFYTASTVGVYFKNLTQGK